VQPRSGHQAHEWAGMDSSPKSKILEGTQNVNRPAVAMGNRNYSGITKMLEEGCNDYFDRCFLSYRLWEYLILFVHHSHWAKKNNT